MPLVLYCILMQLYSVFEYLDIERMKKVSRIDRVSDKEVLPPLKLRPYVGIEMCVLLLLLIEENSN